MALLEVNLAPSKHELRWFGVIVLAVFCAIGGMIYWQTGSPPLVLLGVGATLCTLHYAVPAIRRPTYVAFMYAVLPIGWVISHAMFGVTYHCVLTPIGLVGQMLGRDPLSRKRSSDDETYWIDRKTNRDPLRYFRQH